MSNIPNKPLVKIKNWINGETKLNQTNMAAGINRNISSMKVAIDSLIDALGGENHRPPALIDGVVNFKGIVATPSALPSLEDSYVGDAYFVGEEDPYDLYIVAWASGDSKQWCNVGHIAQGCDVVDSEFSLVSTNPVSNRTITRGVGKGESLNDANRASLVTKGLPFIYNGRRYTFASSDGLTAKYTSTDVGVELDGRNVVKTYILYFAVTDPNDPCRIVGDEVHTAEEGLALLSAADVAAMWGS